MLPTDTEGYKEAQRILQRYNPRSIAKDLTGVNYFEGLEAENKRFVPFNG